MVNVLFITDRDMLREPGLVRTLYDPACSTGGMLSVAESYLNDLNPKAKLEVFGQEINPESYATCKDDMLIKGQNPANIKFGNSFTADGLEDEKSALSPISMAIFRSRNFAGFSPTLFSATGG